jgi:hypothetical protein
MAIDNMYTITIQVRDRDAHKLPIGRAEVRIHEGTSLVRTCWTEPDGCVSVELGQGEYTVDAYAFGQRSSRGDHNVSLPKEQGKTVYLNVPVGYHFGVVSAGGEVSDYAETREGGAIVACVSWGKPVDNSRVRAELTSSIGAVQHDYRLDTSGKNEIRRYYHVDLRGAHGIARIEAALHGEAGESDGDGETPRGRGATIRHGIDVPVLPSSQSITGDVNVSMRRTATDATEDLGLWVVIRKSTEALSFNNYFRFMNHVLCGEPIGEHHHHAFDGQRLRANEREFERLRKERFLPFNDSEAYRLLKVATESFVMVNCGVALKDFKFPSHDLDYVMRRIGRPVDLNGLWPKYLVAVNGTASATLPYLALIRDKMRDVPLKSSMFSAIDGELPENCFGILRDKLTHPCLTELIWSYWHEEGMLVQSVNSIARRFQNIRGHGHHDPLANLEIDPLRPLNNLFWGFIQDEQHRLSVVRRNYEYDHEYGLRLEGRAVSHPRTADPRSKFIEAFHGLLNLCGSFYRQDDDTTVIADGFPVLNALKEVHLILSQGAHNQYGEAPSTSRIEMMMQQWMLGRPEFRDFLPTRIMVAYPEPWMDRVDAMKKIQGWTDTSVLHFRNLAVFGEQVLLSIRYGAWSTVNEPVQATNWARFWRPEIQGYIHAYRSVTGVDLTAANVAGGVDTTLPSVLLRRRLAQQAAAG